MASSTSDIVTRPDVLWDRFLLPGLSLPLNWQPLEQNTDPDRIARYPKIQNFDKGEGRGLFKSALVPSEGGALLGLTTLREFTMLQIMDTLTDKPGWEKKVFNETIAQKWKDELLNTEGRDVSQPMVDWVIEELRYKARLFNETGAVRVYNGDVVKSDVAVSSDTKLSLRKAVKILEDVPEVYKDYHPGSDGKVLDLVHPSLFPLIYGRSRVLPDRLIGLQDCIENIGYGLTIPIPPDSDLDSTMAPYQGQQIPADGHSSPYSKHFQWLPCEVDISNSSGDVKITSYINNLHPHQHKDLYRIIENVIAASIPLWNMSLTGSVESHRIDYPKAMYDIDPDDIPDNEGPQRFEGEDENVFWERRYEWLEEQRHVLQPEPKAFDPKEMWEERCPEESKVDLRRDYSQRGLQVIVKLANIELSPEKPEYEGGTWHVEGQLNEHICATALYYYDNTNITPSRLAFRQQVQSESTVDIYYPQDEKSWLPAVFGCTDEAPSVQEVGSTLCAEDRLLTFPNLLQHRVQPFRLADPARPGHRKLLALFLVDPHIRVLSSANVPPQQRHWWRDVVTRTGALSRLHNELQDVVFDLVDDFPIGMEDAKEVRGRLMEERKRFVVLQNEGFESDYFSLCEH